LTSRSLVTSHARHVAPTVQRRRERALIAAARLGETHLHVSTLVGEVLGLGEFQFSPPPPDERARGDAIAGAKARVRGPELWRRHTGGRALACGSGFALITLALPHRAALVAASPADLRPEQVMNRAVRGFLRMLRDLGVDPTYPGLDLVTSNGRAIAHVSFSERDPGGATLCQITLAIDASFADTPRLLDRADPTGVIPATFFSTESATSLSEFLAGASVTEAARELADPEALAAFAAGGYAKTFGVELLDLDPEVTEAMLEDEPGPVDSSGGPPLASPAGARSATITGLLGPVTAWVRTVAGRIDDVALSGDIIAPPSLGVEIRDRLVGAEASQATIVRVVGELLGDGGRAYLLGLKPDATARLIAEAAGA
jgi:hypothetical protein